MMDRGRWMMLDDGEQPEVSPRHQINTSLKNVADPQASAVCAFVFVSDRVPNDLITRTGQ